jgi:hypothetical protein
MNTDSDTFLVTVYCQIDTLLQELALPIRPGPPPKMSDSEILTLALIGHWRSSSERELLRWARDWLPAYFPVLLSQSAFNRRVRRLGPVCRDLLVRLADLLVEPDCPYEAVDTVSVPFMRQCRGDRQRLFVDREAGVGRGGSDHQFYYGAKLLLALTQRGVITGLVVAPANTNDRWLLEHLLTWRVTPYGLPWTVADIPRSARRPQGRVGLIGPCWWPESVGRARSGLYLADRGFDGVVWHDHWRRDTAAEVQTTTDLPVGDPRRYRHNRCRQIVETINSLLTETFHLHFPQGRTIWGMVTRIVGKCTAVNVAIWCNRQVGRPDLAAATLFPG